MTLFAMLFPGQGSQYVGMLSSFFKENNNIFKYTFDEASHYINFNLLKLIREGPKITLNQSQYSQAAILTASVSIYRFWKKQNGKSPLLISGHSLGEYSALVCANAIKFSDALKIVFLRGTLMHRISINRPSLMQAIIKVDEKKIQRACLMVSRNKIVSLASINSNNQIVISGDKSAVYQAGLKCKKFGAKYILNLNINIPAHSKLMIPVAKKLQKKLKCTAINTPKIPVINNVDVKSEKNSKNIKNALIRQVYSTVRWKEIVDLIQNKRIFTMLEVGPSTILTNLMKQNKNITALNTHNFKNFLIALHKINKEKDE